jgi:hypothetical protein
MVHESNRRDRERSNPDGTPFGHQSELNNDEESYRTNPNDQCQVHPVVQMIKVLKSLKGAIAKICANLYLGDRAEAERSQ